MRCVIEFAGVRICLQGICREREGQFNFLIVPFSAFVLWVQTALNLWVHCSHHEVKRGAITSDLKRCADP